MNHGQVVPEPARARQGRWWFVLGALLVGIAIVAARMAARRHWHIDEYHNVFTMQLASVWGAPADADPLELFHVIGSLVTRHLRASVPMFEVLRMVFSAIFVALLLAVAWAQPFFTTPRGRALSLLGVTSFWPLWRHGYEVRHDVLVALGVAGLLALNHGAARLARTRGAEVPRGSGARPATALTREARGALERRAALAGFIAALMQLNSHKAVTLWGPGLLCMAVIAAWASPDRPRAALVRAVGAEAGGAVLGVALGFSIFATVGAPGTLEAYVDRLVHFAEYASGAKRFSPLPLLALFGRQGTVVVLLALAFTVATGAQMWRRQAPVHVVITAAFLASAILALVVNPTPFPYNIVWLAPALLWAAAGGARLVLDMLDERRGSVVAAVLLAVVAGQGFLVARSDAYSAKGQAKQREVMETVEALTGEDDPVFDGAGLIPARPPASRHWIIHSLFMDEYLSGRRERFRDIVERAAPPVVVSGHYRFAWLPEDDKRALDAAYVPLGSQIMVLGARLEEARQHVRVRRTGRYLIEGPSHDTASHDTAGRDTADHATINGATISLGAAVELLAGEHTVEAPPGSRLAWLGPRLDSLPSPRHQSGRLFAPARLK